MKKSRQVLTAGAAAMVFSSVVGSAVFLTLNSPRAEFLPETSVWQNSLLPGMADNHSRYNAGGAGSRSSDFLNMDFETYGDAFSYGGGAGQAAQLAALNSAGGGSDFIDGSGNSDGGSSHNGGSGHNGDIAGQGADNAAASAGPGSPASPTFSATPSAWDAVRAELERSIEPPSSRGNENENGDDELAEFNPDDTMTPDPTDALPPIDQQPLPERPVPEPQSLALLLLGIAGLRALRYRRSA